MVSPSTRDTSTAVVEEIVVSGASDSSVQAETCLSDNVDGSRGSFSSRSKSYSSSSTKMLSSFPCHMHTQRHHEFNE
jgi:hypothetical protein